MFRTAITIISAMLAAAAIAVPAASTAPPRTSTESQSFSLGTALYEYQQSKNGAQAGSKQGPAYSLGPALLDYRRGTGFFARPTATTRDNGFDWGQRRSAQGSP
jgi:opacity protein-like surface antigen